MKEFDKQIMHFLEDKRKVSIGSAWARGGATSQVVRVEDILPALVDVFRKAPEHPVLAVCLRMWGGHGQAENIKKNRGENFLKINSSDTAGFLTARF